MKVEYEVVKRRTNCNTKNVKRGSKKQRERITAEEPIRNKKRSAEGLEQLVRKQVCNVLESRNMPDSTLIQGSVSGTTTAEESSMNMNECENRYNENTSCEGVLEQSSCNSEQNENEHGRVIIEPVGNFFERQCSSVGTDTPAINDDSDADCSDEDDEETRTAFIKFCRKVRASDEREFRSTTNEEEDEKQGDSTVSHEGDNNIRRTNEDEQHKEVDDNKERENAHEGDNNIRRTNEDEQQKEVEDNKEWENYWNPEVVPTANYEVIELEDDSDDDGNVGREADVTGTDCNVHYEHDSNIELYYRTPCSMILCNIESVVSEQQCFQLA
jgi:hypothetical protein